MDKAVVACPNDIFETGSVAASSYLDVDRRIEVRSGPGDGIQLFRDSRRALGLRRDGLSSHSRGDDRD
ncbi:hypothetical protein ABZS77_20825 [Micromonospora sp. NPDC005298]|uniref:hypothetical protein n=1 Tax=Micromonospora sp. NPDC005298 TaxID=3156873 RepID=UPI0033AD53EB